MKLTPTQQDISTIFLKSTSLQSSSVHDALLGMGKEISLVSVKRSLAEMTKMGVISVNGGGRSTSYRITTLGRIFSNVNPNTYIEMEPDKRYGLQSYNFDLFAEFPNTVFGAEELVGLKTATKDFIARSKSISPTIEEKELQRLIIELAWKSSKIEGNTYTLLDTEKLILEAKEAVGHDKSEAQMILNHKDAFNFIRENEDYYKSLTIANIEKLHSILTKDLDVGSGLRRMLVGITGAKYKPLDNFHQIKEAVLDLSQVIDKATDPYTKALLALVGISYIQPFEDGNKRTGRLMANAILMAHQCAPLSYRSVEEEDYRKAILVFYELNSVMPFKKIFIDQYLFASSNYAIK
jgi:Fic family protein